MTYVDDLNTSDIRCRQRNVCRSGEIKRVDTFSAGDRVTRSERCYDSVESVGTGGANKIFRNGSERTSIKYVTN